MIVAIACDHGGFSLKTRIMDRLVQAGFVVLDCGAEILDPADDYPDFTRAIGEAMQREEADRGILICGSGVGASIAANKIRGIRAGLCHDTFSAHQGVEDDDMNVLCLGGRVIGVELAQEIVEAFLKARFSGLERHRRRVAKVMELERERSIPMKMNPLKQLESLGQSLWLDYIRRDLISSGRLQQYIQEDGLRGMTSNPSIFQKAIVESHDYDDLVRSMSLKDMDPSTIYATLSQKDVRDAADLFRPIYDQTEGRDGFVSLEVNPHWAHETDKTIREARELWASLDRPNVMIKVPGTKEGLPAIRALVSEGVNINVTLLFGLDRYREVVEAYLGGLDARASRGEPLNRIASVASFFVSRIDTMIDPELRKLKAENLIGEAAIANAKMAYQIFKETFGSERFTKLSGKGARPQRLLWASTSTKDPSYSDVKYVDALVGPDTVNTVPPETLDAYRDHGHPAPQIEQGLEKVVWVLARLLEVGVHLEDITQKLEEDGVAKFAKDFDQLMDTLRRSREAILVSR